MMTATATEVQNNFGKYLQKVQEGEEVVVLKNGKAVARIMSYAQSLSFLTDSLTGVLEGDYDDKKTREERMSRHEAAD